MATSTRLATRGMLVNCGPTRVSSSFTGKQQILTFTLVCGGTGRKLRAPPSRYHLQSEHGGIQVLMDIQALLYCFETAAKRACTRATPCSAQSHSGVELVKREVRSFNPQLSRHAQEYLLWCVNGSMCLLRVVSCCCSLRLYEQVLTVGAKVC